VQGGFLLANQVMVHSAMGLHHRGGWLGGWQGFHLGIGVCLLFAETRTRLANLLIWASLGALHQEIKRRDSNGAQQKL